MLANRASTKRVQLDKLGKEHMFDKTRRKKSFFCPAHETLYLKYYKAHVSVSKNADKEYLLVVIIS